MLDEYDVVDLESIQQIFNKVDRDVNGGISEEEMIYFGNLI